MNAMDTALLHVKWMHARRRPEVEIVVSHLSADKREKFIAFCQQMHDQQADMDSKRRAAGYPFKEARTQMEEDTANMAASIVTMRNIAGPIAPLPEDWAMLMAA